MSHANLRFSSKNTRRAAGFNRVSNALPQIRKGTMMAANSRAGINQMRGRLGGWMAGTWLVSGRKRDMENLEGWGHSGWSGKPALEAN